MNKFQDKVYFINVGWILFHDVILQKYIQKLKEGQTFHNTFSSTKQKCCVLLLSLQKNTLSYNENLIVKYFVLL